MMKKSFSFAAVLTALLMVSCSKDVVLDESPMLDDLVDVVYRVDGWQMSKEPMMTRASMEDLQMTDLWVMVYSADTLTTMVHQTSGDADFGSVSFKLKYGAYKACFVASRGGDPVVDTDAATITWAKPNDTMWYADSLTVDATSSANHDVELHRATARVKIKVNDVLPDNAATFTFKPSHWYYGIDYLTGEAVADNAQKRTVAIPQSYLGTSSLAVSLMSISGADDWTTDADVVLHDADGVTIGSVTLSDIPMKRNYSTTYSGYMMRAGSRMVATSAEEWIESEMEW